MTPPGDDPNTQQSPRPSVTVGGFTVFRVRHPVAQQLGDRRHRPAYAARPTPLPSKQQPPESEAPMTEKPPPRVPLARLAEKPPSPAARRLLDRPAVARGEFNSSI